MNKVGVEFAIGTVVLLIITIVIFSLSLYFLFSWFGQAQTIGAEIDSQTQQQILSVLKSGNQLVVNPIPVAKVTPGNFAHFGIGIRNLESEKKLGTVVQFSQAYTPSGQIITGKDPTYITSHWLGNFATLPLLVIKKNEQQVITLPIKVDSSVAVGKSTPRGDYVFDVCISEQTIPCDLAHISQLYSGKIYQVTIRVV